MVTVEELDTRLRIVENEIAGEKLVSRHVLTQAQHNADDLAEIKTQSRHLLDDMALVKAAQVAQGGTLNILVQDVGALRSDATQLRRGQEAMNARLDRMEEEGNMRFEATNVRFDRMQDETNTRFDRMQGETNARFDRLEGATNARFDRLESSVAAILAAVTRNQ